MPQTPLPASTIRKLLHRCVTGNFSNAQIARQLRISRTSATKYIYAFKKSSLSLCEIDSTPLEKITKILFPKSKSSFPSDRRIRLLACLPSIHHRVETEGLSVLDAWRDEVPNPSTYKYSQFAALYAIWRFMLFGDRSVASTG
jgi:hypothetical protein